MNIHTKLIKAGEFKAHCLELMDIVKNEHMKYIITKRGIPVAKLVPIENGNTSPFGCMKDTVTFIGDLVKPIDVKWNIMNEKDFT